MSTTDVLSLRERKKHETREALGRIALELFTRHGFGAVTVDEIAAAANVSPRTFFRYFASKEAVLFADQDQMLELLEASISERPAEEPPLLAVRRALAALVAHYASHRAQHRERGHMAETGADVAAYQRAVVQPRWEQVLCDALAARLGVDADTDLRPRLLAGTAVAALNATGAIWLADDGHVDLDDLLTRAFDELAFAALEAGGAS